MDSVPGAAQLAGAWHRAGASQCWVGGLSLPLPHPSPQRGGCETFRTADRWDWTGLQGSGWRGSRSSCWVWVGRPLGWVSAC